MKLRIILSILTILPVILSCSLEYGDDMPGNSSNVVYLSSDRPQLSAVQDMVQTKTHTDGKSILWTKDDRIKVFASKDGLWLDESGLQRDDIGGVFLLSPTALKSDSTKASFAIPPDFLNEMKGNWIFYGVYPPECLIDKHMSDTSSLRFRLPYRQIPIIRNGVKSFDSTSDIMIGKTGSIENLQNGASYPIEWDRVVGHLVISFENLPSIADTSEVVTSISIEAEESAALVGDFSYELSTGKCKALSSSNIVNIVSDGSNIRIKNGTIEDICICLMPRTITSMKVEIRTDRAVYHKSFDKISCGIVRNRLTTMTADMVDAKVERITETETDPDNSLIINKSYDINIPEHVIDKHTITGMGTFYLYTPEVSAPGAFDLHLNVFPLYVFGTDENISGDYYCVEGSITSHNALTYAERTYNQVWIYGWYPSQFDLEFQLLSPDGKQLGSNEVEFFTYPEPSTSIGSSTYTKGTTFTLGPKLTFGGARPEGVSGILAWVNTALGMISVGYSYDSSSKQHLPDQGISLKTDAQTQAVNYSFITFNDTGGYSTASIPLIFRSNQSISFSWVWHVKTGKYCAKDYDFGNMKMAVKIKPTYKAAYKGKIVNTYGRAVFEGRALYEHPDLTANFDLPAMNRIPTGDIELKYIDMVDNNYLTQLKVYRSGEYSPDKKPYYSDTSIYKKNQIAKIPIRVGTYDIVYKIQDREYGTVISHSIIKNVKVTANNITEKTTFDSEAL